MEKIIFLDIDGVLNNNTWSQNHQGVISDDILIDEKKVKLLYKIIKATGAGVVLHSGWKIWFNDMIQPTRKESQKLVEILGRCHITIFDITPDFSTEEIRKTRKFSLVKAKEILSWLHGHPEIRNWIVLDDLYLHDAEIEKHQIMTNQETGLVQEDVELAIAMLNKL